MSEVAIIVPCYNQAKFLDVCLESVLQQTFEDWECIIVNDGSTDNTGEVAKKWTEKDDRFHYIFKENGGLSSARNFGLQNSESKFVAFLDCDDAWKEKKLEKQLTLIQEKNVDLVFSDALVFHEKIGDTEQKLMVRESFYSLKENFPDFLVQNRIPVLTVLCKREMFQKSGYFEIVKKAEDYLQWLKFILDGYVLYGTDEVLAYYRIHSESMSSGDRYTTEEVLQNFKLIENRFEREGINYKKYISFWITRRIKSVTTKADVLVFLQSLSKIYPQDSSRFEVKSIYKYLPFSFLKKIILQKFQKWSS